MNSMDKFKEFVYGKCKEWNIDDFHNIYFTETEDGFFADYRISWKTYFTIFESATTCKRSLLFPILESM